jgi:outer membrane protein OmpA-like peptidoglycan-associated protein
MKFTFFSSVLPIAVVLLFAGLVACHPAETALPAKTTAPAGATPASAKPESPSADTVNALVPPAPPLVIPDKMILGKGRLKMTANSALLLPNGRAMVQKAAAAFQASEGRLALVVTGYTPNLGARERNMILSHHQAEVVAKALMQNGVPGAQITVRGLGPENPLGDNRTAAGRTLNHRVEIEFVEVQN